MEGRTTYIEPLNDREREVVGFIVDGHTTREIGAKLGLSPRTVEIYRQRALEKLGARNTAELVRITLTGS